MKQVIIFTGISSSIVFGAMLMFMSYIGATSDAMGYIGFAVFLASILIIQPAMELCDYIELSKHDKDHIHAFCKE